MNLVERGSQLRPRGVTLRCIQWTQCMHTSSGLGLVSVHRSLGLGPRSGVVGDGGRVVDIKKRVFSKSKSTGFVGRSYIGI